MNHRIRNVVIILILAAGIVVPLWLWMRPSAPEERASAVVSASPTPISGRLRLAVDRSLMPVATVQSRAFSDQYAKASIALDRSSSRPVLQLLRHEAGAVLIEGALSAEEDSVITAMQRSPRQQPVARNAMVLVVNRANPVASFTLDELRQIFSGKVTNWSAVGGPSGRIVPCLNGSDWRSRLVLSSLLFGKRNELDAAAEPTLEALLERVRRDCNVVAAITMPAWAEALRSGENGGRLRAVPVVGDDGGVPVTASPATVYHGDYPLSTVVLYLYDPYDPLATGFGAWLSKDGQKLFERGDMAPYQQLVRTIIIK
ncbi:MAG TPA: phosphate-binding protein [Chlorobaculum parvum]|uniref:Phosphate-binding protein n=1 Tax=Chlorobaculum parvum TaxID=274539 RepID=A0A7C5HPT1_9CHLB|nr:phosphate-binding protein [Chlorobaculum parvum]